MSTQTDPIERLGSLAARDREWIVRHLSEDARQRLRERTAQERAALDRDPPDRDAGGLAAAVTDDERALELLEAEQVAAALAGEPPWIVATVLGLRAWPWEAEFLQQLAPVARVELSRLRLAAPSLTPAMRELVLDVLRARLAAPATAPATGFERLLHRARRPERAHR